MINEVDLGVFFTKYKKSFDPIDMFLCEYKTEIDFTNKDIEKMQKPGQLFPGAILTFATLKPELSNNEKQIIRRLVNYFRKGINDRPVNPVLILTGNELLPKSAYSICQY